MIDVSRLGERGDRDQGNPRAVPEEIEGLNKSRVVVAAPLIRGDEDGAGGPEPRISLHPGNQIGYEPLVGRRGGIRRMPGQTFKRSDKGDLRKRAATRHILIKLKDP